MATPKHPAATALLNGGLFDGISSFGELENRIAALPTALDRGKDRAINNCRFVGNEWPNFFATRGNDLDRLTASEFEIIRAWLKGAVVQPKKKTPFRHQQEALNDLVSVLKRSERATTVMASATGKTLVGRERHGGRSLQLPKRT